MLLLNTTFCARQLTKSDILCAVLSGVNKTRPIHGELPGEDTRAFSLNGQIVLEYSMHKGKFKTVHYAYPHYNSALLHSTQGGDSTKGILDFHIAHSEQHNIAFEGDVHQEGQQTHQKNWCPFEYCPSCIFKQVSFSLIV